jgi:hypothetical protein
LYFTAGLKARGMHYYRNQLELELDDWLDPSLPRMYRFTPEATRPFYITQDFTDQNEEFVATPIAPPFTPLMQKNGCIELVATRI